jgi:hypothetical protein
MNYTNYSDLINQNGIPARVETGLPILTQLNNSQLGGAKAMPLKNITSDNNAFFEIPRQEYVRSYTPALNQNYRANLAVPLFNRQIQHRQGNHIGSNTVPNQNLLIKKWTANRDASQITRDRRVNTVGNASLNASGGRMSFNSGYDNNRVNEAIIRTRSGGAAVPKKVTGRYLNPVRTVG